MTGAHAPFQAAKGLKRRYALDASPQISAFVKLKLPNCGL